MAQRQVNHDSISYNGITADSIAQIRARMDSGEVILRSDVNKLISWITAWDNHTHTYTDYYQQATFGNNGDRNNYEESKTTQAHDERSNLMVALLDGAIISSGTVNAMVSRVNKLRSHKHVINDRTS